MHISDSKKFRDVLGFGLTVRELGLREKLENMSPRVINHTYSPVNYPYSPVVSKGLFRVGEKCEKLI